MKPLVSFPNPVRIGTFGCVALLLAAAPHHAFAQGTADSSGNPPEAPSAPATFDINAFDIAGIKSVTQGEIERAVYPFEGPGRTATDVESAQKAVQAVYTQHGFEAVVVEIPNQPDALFERGIVQLTVNEVPVGQVRVVGAKFHSSRKVEKQLASIAPGKPLDLPALQRDVASANRFPDREIEPKFVAGAVPGVVDVELKVRDTFPVHGSLQVDNDASPLTSPLRLAASLRYTNLWQAGHTLTATYIVAPQHRSETEVISGSYTAPLIGTPWTLLLYGYKSNSNIAALGGTSVLGKGYQVGLRGIYRLPSEKVVQSISFGLDYKDFKQDIFVGTTNSSQAPIRYIPLVVEYSGSGGGELTSFDYSLGGTFGLRTIKRVACFDATATPANCVLQDQFKNKDFDSNENFVHVNFTGNYSIETSLIPKKSFGLAARVTGQYADSHLVTNEQYSVGGLNTVRGYFQSEAVGDDGIAASLEMRLPSLADLLGDAFDEFRVYSFFEGGYVRTRGVLPGQISHYTLASVGLGARFRIFRYFSSDVLVGVPLRDGPNSRYGDPQATIVARGEF